MISGSSHLTHVELRRAQASDAEAIELLYRELVSDPTIRVLPEHVALLAESASSFLLVGCSSGIVCATALLTLCPDVMYQRQPFGLVENVIVAERYRGTGIGRRLMDHLEGVAREHHCTKLMLLSASHRHSAHRFFEALGFEGDKKTGFVKYGSKFRTA
jgi:N-acetylglutamate synthase-like GNAT family acetyltransferase